MKFLLTAFILMQTPNSTLRVEQHFTVPMDNKQECEDVGTGWLNHAAKRAIASHWEILNGGIECKPQEVDG